MPMFTLHAKAYSEFSYTLDLHPIHAPAACLCQAVASSGHLFSSTIVNRAALYTLRRWTAGGASKDTIRDEL